MHKKEGQYASLNKAEVVDLLSVVEGGDENVVGESWLKEILDFPNATVDPDVVLELLWIFHIILKDS